MVNEETKSEIILSLKSKAFGNDIKMMRELNSTLILLCCSFIISFITHIINCCIEQSYFPKTWKIANIIPLVKKDNY